VSRKTRKTAKAVALGRTRATGQTRVADLVEALGSTDPESRCFAVLKLSRHGGDENVAALREKLGGEDLELAACARIALTKIEAKPEPATSPTPALQELVGQLVSPYPPERLAAIRKLCARPVAEALPPLLTSLEVEIDGGVLSQLVRAVARLDGGARRALILGYFAHRDARVRAAALESLWGDMDPAIGQAALPLAKDESSLVKASALVLLIRRATETSRAMAQTVLASQRTWMRLTALFALGGMTEPWARQMVIQTIRNPALPSLVRAAAREAIGLAASGAHAPSDDATVFTDLTRHLPPIGDAEVLSAALDDQDPLWRVHGLQNAHRFGQTALPWLVRQVQHETDPLVLATLVKALARVGGGAHQAAIRGFLEHEDERVRSNALEALALASPGPELDGVLKNLLAEDEGPRLRKQAASQLFASNPDAAVAHFRGLVLGQDASARGGALSIVASVKDDRLLAVMSDALRDQRRDVYSVAAQTLTRCAREWPAAGELLAAFQAGKVAGEVVDGEPVSALLHELNSAKAADRVRAMSRLVGSRDMRVNTMLEMNLGARDPEVAHEAARVLRERHRHFTLPGLYEQLGELYGRLTRAGHILVPQDVAARLPDVPEAGEALDADRLRWLGKALYDTFEEDVELDDALRTVCLEVRSALEQLGQIASPASKVERSAALEALRREHFAQLRDDARGRDDSPGADGEEGRFKRPAFAAAACVTVLAVMFSWSAGEEPPPAAEGGPAAASSVRSLDSMALEPNPERFKQRFGGRPVSITGKLLSSPGGEAADVRSGTVMFRVKAKKGAIPPELRVAGPCQIEGTVVELDASGVIHVEGTLIASREL
jgi:HEAT repeat protein